MHVPVNASCGNGVLVPLQLVPDQRFVLALLVQSEEIVMDLMSSTEARVWHPGMSPSALTKSPEQSSLLYAPTVQAKAVFVSSMAAPRIADEKFMLWNDELERFVRGESVGLEDEMEGSPRRV